MTGTSPRTKILDVTQDDINNGQRFSGTGCPFALAGRRLFGTNDLAVDGHFIFTRNGTECWAIDPAGVTAIARYDFGAMFPGRYTLTLCGGLAREPRFPVPGGNITKTLT